MGVTCSMCGEKTITYSVFGGSDMKDGGHWNNLGIYWIYVG
jgi:hypothetical protein